jgi:predicted amidohydrolase
LVADPWGTVIAEAPDGVGVTFAEPDLAQVEHVRHILPSLRHRRLQPSC